VRQCRECGANLPDQAKFCLQCGTAVERDDQVGGSGSDGTPKKLDFIQPALAGGMFLGLLSSIPILSAANLLCCMWVLIGGGIASYLLTRQRPSGITYGDGAFAGVLSGLFGAVVGTVLQIPVQIISARLFDSQRDRIEEILRQFGVEGPMRDWMVRIFSGEISIATVLFTFFANLLMWSLFAMIGGILTVAILNKRKNPPAKL
jgi:hypothetical protein